MGKRARRSQRRQTAHSGSQTARVTSDHASTERTPPAVRKTSANTDPLFGTYLVSDGSVPTVPVRDWDARRDQTQRKPIPLSIHSGFSRMDRANGSHAARLGKYAGGLAWSPAFVEYIAPVVPNSVRAERLTCWEWWRVDYVHRGVLRAFPGMRDRQAIAAILAVRRDGRDMTAVATEYGHSAVWVSRTERRIARFVRHMYGLGGRIGPEIEVWHAPGVLDRTGGPMVTGEVAG
ncbi:MAG: hypothetical protein IVW57_00300 [Ktedonobacterales bacterium]|nr:hypothetical protein [Ktedonobacterales bacterium]